MSLNSKISEEQWNLWLLDPCTQAIREWAKEEVESLRDKWESANFVASLVHEEIARNNAAQGACSILRQIEALNYQDMMGAEDVSATEGSVSAKS